MKRLLAGLLALLATGCAGACASAPIAAKAVMGPKAPDMTGVLRLQGRFASASACPISPTQALTAAHAGDLRPFDKDTPLVPFVWEDGDGHSGFMKPTKVSMHQDLAEYTPEQGEFAHPFPIAARKPEPGDRVWLLGFDWRNSRQAFGPRVLEALVVRVVAGTVVLNRAAWPGSSGTCVLNDAGEVVGILRSLHEMENGSTVSAAVGVWR